MMTQLYVSTRLVWKEHEQGATAAEYSLLLLLITVAIVVAVRNFGGSLPSIFEGFSNELDASVPTTTVP